MLRVRVTLGAMTIGPGLSTFYFDGVDQAAADDAAGAVTTFMTAIESAMVSYGTWSLETQVAQVDIGTGELEAVYNVAPASGLGDVGDTQLALATQGLLQLRTGSIINGRELRGRLFIPGPTEGHNDLGGRPTAAYIADVNAAAAGLVADSAGWGVWGRASGSFVEITAATCWSQWAVLRSRRD